MLIDFRKRSVKYNRPSGTASWGTRAKDWERGIDYDRLSKQRIARAQAAIKSAGPGAVICFDFDTIRPIISKRYRGQTAPLNDGMVFALETWKGPDDGSGAVRIEEEVVVTKVELPNHYQFSVRPHALLWFARLRCVLISSTRSKFA
jgi:hypothetical protein